MAETITTEDGGTATGQRMLPLIEYLSRIGRRSAEARMGQDCLRPRHLIALNVLGEHGPMTQHALGVALSLDPSNVVGLLNDLEDRGLIVRRRDPADRRRHIVELSAVGSEQVIASNGQLGQVEDDLFKTLTAQERATLYGLLARAVSAQAPGDSNAACSEAAAECAGPSPTECTEPQAGR